MPMKSKLGLAAIPALLLSLSLVHAATAAEAPSGICADFASVLKQAYPAAQADKDGLVVAGPYAQRVTPKDVACKIWPAKPELTLLAVPLIEANPPEEGESKGDVEIIIADSKSGQPLARRREGDMAFGDAVKFDGVTLDTARYDIKPGQRAFGILTSQSGSSQMNPFWEHDLWLYSFENGRIERVLDGLTIDRLNGEIDGECIETSTTTKRSISIGGSGAHGYRQLLVDEIVTTETAAKVGDSCKSTRKARSKQLRLQFDGQRYVLSGASKAKPEDDDLFSAITVVKTP